MQSSRTVVVEFCEDIGRDRNVPKEFDSYVEEQKKDTKYLYLKWDISPEGCRPVDSMKAAKRMVVELQDCQRSGSAYLDDELNDHFHIWSKQRQKGISQRLRTMFKSSGQKAKAIDSYYFRDLEAHNRFNGVFQDEIIEDPKTYFRKKHGFKFEFWSYDDVFTGNGELPSQYRPDA